MRFTITSEYVKMRLDKFLKEHFPDFSRAYLQKLIKSGQVRVNGKSVTAHHFLKEGDKVEATIEAPEELRVVANPEVEIVVHNPPQPSLILREGDRSEPPLRVRGGRGSYDNVVQVIHEEPDFLIINKPAGLTVHQGEGHKAPDTLANGLIARYPEIAKVGDDPVRPGIVHRLDGDVSGVMVVARTQDMFDHLKRQFKLQEVEKEYVAVVEGKVEPPEGVIEFAVGRKGAKMVARPRGGEGRRAVTEYETVGPIGHISPIGPITVLKIRTRTGRTHQIRVHLKAKGWPIVGDRLYNAKLKMQNVKLVEPPRLMLHAKKLGFLDLQGKWREFESTPSTEFKL